MKAKRKRIAPISKVRAERLKIYAKQRKVFLATHPLCVVFPDRKSEDIHHVIGRAGKLLLDERYWLAVSREGHNLIHSNIKEAQAKGLIAANGKWLNPDK